MVRQTFASFLFLAWATVACQSPSNSNQNEVGTAPALPSGIQGPTPELPADRSAWISVPVTAKPRSNASATKEILCRTDPKGRGELPENPGDTTKKLSAVATLNVDESGSVTQVSGLASSIFVGCDEPLLAWTFPAKPGEIQVELKLSEVELTPTVSFLELVAPDSVDVQARASAPILACYQKELTAWKKSPTWPLLQGTSRVEITISKQAKIEQVNVSAIGVRTLDQCISDTLKTLSFSKGSTNEPITLLFKLQLSLLPTNPAPAAAIQN